MNYYLFGAVASLIFTAMNYYCYKSLRANAILAEFSRTLAGIFLGVNSLEMAFFFSFSGYRLNFFLYQVAIFCVGATFMIFCVLVLFDAAAKFGAKFNHSRRKAIKFLLDIGVLIGAFGYVFKGFYNANFALHHTKYELELANLARNFKFAVISDVHIGEFLKKDFLQKIVDKISEMRADAVFIVGDLADLKASELGDLLDPLRDLENEFGTFFVAGNHEYYHGLSELLSHFEGLGVKVLQNQSVNFGGLNLAGSYDLAGFRFGDFEPDFSKTLSEIEPNSPTILLTHQPKSLKYIASQLLEKVDLIVCGHTHAGQIFPFSLLVWLDQKYVYGLHQITEKTRLLVSSGAGFWGPPMRILSISEIVELNLKVKT